LTQASARGDRQHGTESVREWQLEKYGGKPRRTWRKLHLAVDPDSGGILASELTTTGDGDASGSVPCSTRSRTRSPL